MIWAYFILLPYLWNEVVRACPLPLRIALCLALFGSGFVCLFGGLSSGRPGHALANRAEIDTVGAVMRGDSAALDTPVEPFPVQARFAAFPTYNHPLLLQGRNVVLGYPGHLWTAGFKYAEEETRLTNLMMGRENWQDEARVLGVRYIFWGREEIENYETREQGAPSTKPWEHLLTPVYKGEWCTIYDLQQLETTTAQPQTR
jgi:hypothetical protein